MKVPLPPPDRKTILDKLIKEDPTKVAEMMLGRWGSTDDRGRYLHWDKVRYLQPPAGLSSEEFWLALKLSRQTQYKPLRFYDKSNKPFQYLVTDGMLEVLHWLDQNASGSIRMPQPITNPGTRDTYLVSSLMEEAINSSLIEGAATSREVAKEMLREGRRPKDHSEQMIANNYRAMQFVREVNDEHLTKEMILELHRILTEDTLEDPDNAGRLRTASDKIHVVSMDQKVLHTPPDAPELEERLTRLCDFANHKESGKTFLHPLLKAMILHFMIGYDHPFVDGNGRTARALFYWYALRHGYWLLEFLSISAVIKEAPQQYVQAYLHTETDDNDVTYFLIHQLETVKKALERLHDYLRRKAAETEDAEKLLDRTVLRGTLNHRQLALLHHAMKHPGFLYTIEGHKNSHNISYQTARTDLLKLSSEEVPLLRRRKQGNAFVFVAPVDMRKSLRNLQKTLV
jgi:Fic family protein